MIASLTINIFVKINLASTYKKAPYVVNTDVIYYSCRWIRIAMWPHLTKLESESGKAPPLIW